MAGTAGRRGALWIVAAVLLLSACEEQEAVPLSRSLPAATAMAALGAVFVWWTWVTLNRVFRRRHESARRVPVTGFDRLLVGGIVLVVGAGGLATCALLTDVAFKYEQPITDILSWDDTVFLASIVETLVVVLGLLLARYARALWDGRWTARIGGAAVLLAVATLQIFTRNTTAIAWAWLEIGLAVALYVESRRRLA